jgi:hypothetical protein
MLVAVLWAVALMEDRGSVGQQLAVGVYLDEGRCIRNLHIERLMALD